MGHKTEAGGYFQGYDERTRQSVGFIGAEGYQASRPVGDRRFVLGEDFDANRIATQQYAFFGSPSLNYYLPTSAGSPEQVYMALPNRLIQVDLRRRAVSTFAKIANVIAIAISPRATDQDAQEQLYARTSGNIMILDAEGRSASRFQFRVRFRMTIW